MKIIILSIMALVVSSCSNSGSESSSPSTPVDPIYGSWTYVLPGSTTTNAKGYSVNIDANGAISFLQIYVYSDGASAKAYVRKNIGTYSRSGEEFNIKWTHETCNPVGSELVRIKNLSPDNLIASISGDTVQIQFSRTTTTNSITNFAVFEDIKCNILAKLEDTKRERIPASSASRRSFFDFKRFEKVSVTSK